jgi:hypothetical protein
MCVLKHGSHTRPDGHSDITRDQVSKKKSKKLFFFLAGVISKKPGLKFEKKIPEQPLGRLRSQINSLFFLAGVSRLFFFPERTLIVRQSGGEESCEEGKGPPNARSFNEAVVQILYGEIGESHLL